MFHCILLALISVIALIINVLVQVVSFRYISRFTLLKSIFFGFGNGLIVMFIIQLYIYLTQQISAKDFLFVGFANFITYSALGYCYFHFINLGVTARRIRILIELFESKEGLSLSEILARYNSKQMVENRLNRLINSGQVVYEGGRYYIGKPIMLSIAKAIVIMKMIIFNKQSEFE